VPLVASRVAMTAVPGWWYASRRREFDPSRRIDSSALDVWSRVTRVGIVRRRSTARTYDIAAVNQGIESGDVRRESKDGIAGVQTAGPLKERHRKIREEGRGRPG
jgi:hypothetical protein